MQHNSFYSSLMGKGASLLRAGKRERPFSDAFTTAIVVTRDEKKTSGTNTVKN